MQPRAEFTNEPFECEGEPPAHAAESLRILEVAGVPIRPKRITDC